MFVQNSNTNQGRFGEIESKNIWCGNYSTTTLNILDNLKLSYNFFQISSPKNADMNETGIRTGTMNFHKSCSNINTLSKVTRSIPKNDLNIFTDHGKYNVTKKNDMATEKIMRLWSLLDLTDTL